VFGLDGGGDEDYVGLRAKGEVLGALGVLREGDGGEEERKEETELG
jgi:hypothetical protein